MQLDTQHIAKRFKQTAQQTYGEELVKVILFGSHARGDSHADSDIDFLVVINRKYINPFREIRRMNEKVYDLALETDQLISFLPTTQYKYEQSQIPFYENVRKEGIAV